MTDTERPSLLNCSFEDLFAAYRALEAERDQAVKTRDFQRRRADQRVFYYERLWERTEEQIADLTEERDHLAARLLSTSEGLRRDLELQADYEAIVAERDTLKAELERLRYGLAHLHTYTRDPDKPGELVLSADVRALLTPVPSLETQP